MTRLLIHPLATITAVLGLTMATGCEDDACMVDCGPCGDDGGRPNTRDELTFMGADVVGGVGLLYFLHDAAGECGYGTEVAFEWSQVDRHLIPSTRGETYDMLESEGWGTIGLSFETTDVGDQTQVTVDDGTEVHVFNCGPSVNCARVDPA